MRSAGQGGFTLLEMLVAMGLSAVLLTIMLHLFNVGYRVGHEELSRSSAEAAATLAMNRLESDLQSTSPAGLALASDGARLVVHPIAGSTDDRQIVHQERLVGWTYDAASGTLSRSERLSPLPVPFDSRPIRLPAAQLALVPSTGWPRLLSRVRNVSAFRVSNPPDVRLPSIGAPLTVELEVEIPEIPQERARRRYLARRSLTLRSLGN